MYAVEMRGITKYFKNSAANDHIDFYVEKGEIHSLLGENGAGKTTLMNILFGMYNADSGEIIINGEKAEIVSTLDAINHGISMVHQHFMLVDTLTVAENIVLGNEPRKGIMFDREGAFNKVQEIADRYRFRLDSRELVGNLSVGVKQRVEILKALYHESDVLILDEPTAVLTPQEVDELFEILGGLKQDGKTVIIITHKLKETMAIADSVTVLRKGEMIGRYPIEDVDEQKLANLMVGRPVSLTAEKKPMEQGPEKVALKNIIYRRDGRNVLDRLSLSVHAGEILGIAGVEGNGQTELIEVITGIITDYEGTLEVNGKDMSRRGAAEMLKHIGHIPEDRGKYGYVKTMPNWENLILGYHTDPEYMNRFGIMKNRDIRKDAEGTIEEFDIRTDGIEQLTDSLSGGNIQKLIVGRVFRHQSGIVLAAQPTRGVDIGAIEYIHGRLVELRDSGAAVILISADLDEITGLSDTIGVIYEGKIVQCRSAADFSEHEIGYYMLGQNGGEEAGK